MFRQAQNLFVHAFAWDRGRRPGRGESHRYSTRRGAEGEYQRNTATEEVFRQEYENELQYRGLDEEGVAEYLVFNRPCVDCGRITGNFCQADRVHECFADIRIPSEHWEGGQRTPFCSECESKKPCCRFCRGIPSCTPPTHKRTFQTASSVGHPYMARDEWIMVEDSGP